tara:strand:+ start:527 stop:817 length:291 start_codon:yes stop_codon:yes gene_type:complete
MSLVDSVRKCPIVGRGTCSAVDECLSDGEVQEMMDDDNVKTEKEAIKWAIQFESIQNERALNARWGEDSDPELVTWNKFKQNVQTHYPELAKEIGF